jgi:hypothetical protein
LWPFPAEIELDDGSLRRQQVLASGAILGATVALKLLALRAYDGRDDVLRPFEPGTGAGAYVATPPLFQAVDSEFLAYITPFTMNSPSQFRPAGPPRLGSRRYARDYNEVMSVGVKDGSARTPEQTETAMFWQPLAGTVWPATIRRMAVEQSLDLPARAHFEAAAFAAFADGLIACWDASFISDSGVPSRRSALARPTTTRTP